RKSLQTRNSAGRSWRQRSRDAAADLSTQGHHHTRETLFKAFNTYIAAIILESSASLALPPPPPGRRRIRLDSPGSRGAPGGPIYFGRDGRAAGDAVASNFGRSPDSALTTCSRSRRNSCIRDTKSSTFGTDGPFGPGARLDGGRLFCTMKYFQNQSDDNAARTRSKDGWATVRYRGGPGKYGLAPK